MNSQLLINSHANSQLFWRRAASSLKLNAFVVFCLLFSALTTVAAGQIPRTLFGLNLGLNPSLNAEICQQVTALFANSQAKTNATIDVTINSKAQQVIVLTDIGLPAQHAAADHCRACLLADTPSLPLVKLLRLVKKHNIRAPSALIQTANASQFIAYSRPLAHAPPDSEKVNIS